MLKNLFVFVLLMLRVAIVTFFMRLLAFDNCVAVLLLLMRRVAIVALYMRLLALYLGFVKTTKGEQS